jgi:hypothetical protein
MLRCIGVHFVKYDIQGVFLKCAKILRTRLWDNVEDSKNNLEKLYLKNKISLYFLTKFFKYFFGGLHEARG